MRSVVEGLMEAVRQNTLSVLVVVAVAHNKVYQVVEALEKGLIALVLNRNLVWEEVFNNLEML